MKLTNQDLTGFKSGQRLCTFAFNLSMWKGTRKYEQFGHMLCSALLDDQTILKISVNSTRMLCYVCRWHWYTFLYLFLFTLCLEMNLHSGRSVLQFEARKAVFIKINMGVSYVIDLYIERDL
jgi:hypothetical protein